MLKNTEESLSLANGIHIWGQSNLFREIRVTSPVTVWQFTRNVIYEPVLHLLYKSLIQLLSARFTPTGQLASALPSFNSLHL